MTILIHVYMLFVGKLNFHNVVICFLSEWTNWESFLPQVLEANTPSKKIESKDFIKKE